MHHKVQSYIRTHRRRVGLTQQELAFLLGCGSGAKVSRYERLARKPNLETAFACQAIFDAPSHELLPGIYAEVEQAVRQRAQYLAQTLRGRGDTRLAQRKLAFLLALAAPRGTSSRTRL
jgi:transcriptional regulator with XRE-family HTH domain